MMKRECHYRKPGSLHMLAVTGVLAASLTSTAGAGELIDYRPVDPGTRLTSLFMDEGYVHDPANPASRLQVSFTPPAVSTADSRAGSSSMTPSHIQLSWRIRW